MRMNVNEVTTNLINWIKEQFEVRGMHNAVLGISGGKDSTICAMLACLALGKENVYGIMMPNGEQKDISDSIAVCELLGFNSATVNIHNAYTGLTGAIHISKVSPKFGDDVYMYRTNTPARLRMTTLYGVAALVGKALVINTCNLCEDWVGYSTKFGDSAGDISFLARLTVEEVLAIGMECANRLGIPDEIKALVYKAPSDGMCGKTDEDNLGFTYKVLGDYIRTGEISDPEIKEKIDRMHKNNLHKLELMPAFEYNGE